MRTAGLWRALCLVEKQGDSSGTSKRDFYSPVTAALPSACACNVSVLHGLDFSESFKEVRARIPVKLDLPKLISVHCGAFFAYPIPRKSCTATQPEGHRARHFKMLCYPSILQQGITQDRPSQMDLSLLHPKIPHFPT